MTHQLDITLSAAGQPGLYQAEGRDTTGAGAARHTFSYRTDLLATHTRLRTLEQGATLGGDAETAPALRAEAEAFGRDLYGRLFGREGSSPRLHHERTGAGDAASSSALTCGTTASASSRIVS